MLVQIPGKEGKFAQTNQGETSGNIWASWNLDLTSNPGRIRVSPQTTMLYSNIDSTAVVYPVQAVRGNFDNVKERYWVVGDDAMVKSTNTAPDISAWEQDETANTPGISSHLYADAVEFNGSLIVSGVAAGDLAKLTAGTWDKVWWKTTLSQVALNTDVGVPLGKSFNNLLLIGNENIVATVESDFTTVDAARLTFPVEFQVVWIRSSSSLVYFGCRNKNGGRAKVFIWDGYSENFNYDYKINGSECYSGVIKDEICYTMNERGELLAFTGGGFTQIAVLPIFNYDFNLQPTPFSNKINVGRNGMAVQDNKIHILIQTTVGGFNSTVLENQLSGVWVYDPEIGLHLKYSITKAATGVIDYGSPTIVRSGFLLPIDKNSGTLLIGTSLYLADGTTPNTIRHAILKILDNESDVTSKVGYFITPKIQASEVEENWQKIYILIKAFLNSTDKIYVKYRTDFKDFGTLGMAQTAQPATTATWTATNTFTVAADDLSLVAVGDEIEILSGEGSGLSANVSNIDSTAVVIDETVTGASGTIKIRASNWKKVGTDIATQGLRNFELPLDARSSWIQIKVIMFFKGKEEIEKLLIKSEVHQSIK